MSTADYFNITIAGLTLVTGVTFTGLALIVRLTVRWAKVELTIGVITDRVNDLVVRFRDTDSSLSHRIDKVDDKIERHEEWHRGRAT